MAREPLLDTVPVKTSVTIGSRAEKPLKLDIPLFVSYEGSGALSEEAKTAFARNAQMVGTGLRSGAGGMLPREKAENSRYFYELASAKFGWVSALVERVQAFHFKGSQGAISPTKFLDLQTPTDFKMVADEGRERSGGIPIRFKLSANHIEDDIDFTLVASADYIILDGRGGSTGAAPLIFHDHISVTTIPALARARRHLDAISGRDVTLVITGGLRMAKDFSRALPLGADAIALSNSAMQAVGWIAARMCNSNNCPCSVATQKPEFHKRLDVQIRPEKLARYFGSSVELMQVLARACSHSNLSDFRHSDITTWKREMADLSGANFAGFNK
jgi:glutamate synthase domain-containing protein 2